MGTAEREGELWGAKARIWAERCEGVSKPLWEAMMDASSVGPGVRFLDLGCGSAGSSVIAAQRGAKVCGFDASANLLEIARERLPQSEFRQGEIEHLPYEDGAFDVVFAANSIQFVADKGRALAEVRRVMAEDSRFAVGMWCEPERCEMSVVFKALMALAPPPPDDGSPSLAVRDNLTALLESNGFTIRSDGEVECPFEFASVEDFVDSNTSAGAIVGLTRMVGEEPVRQAMADAVRPLAGPDGRIRLSNWFRYVVCT
jgi:SAM-dependent methyltransferase